MMTQTERESNKSCGTGDNKCVPISKARGGGGGGGGDPGFLDRGFKFIKGGSIC